MSSRVYRNHFIMALPSFDPATRSWVPQADISLSDGPARHFEFISSPSRCHTEPEAIEVALNMGEAWIDRYLGITDHKIRAEQGTVFEMVNALKKRLGKVAPRQPPRAQPAVEERLERTLTFDQFKSVLRAGRGCDISEPALQKSYAALLKLRSDYHMSWAEAKRTVERSQQRLVSAEPAARGARSVDIPLTEHEWRKMG